jgi:hypothetical protein
VTIKNPRKHFAYTCVVIPVAVANGVIGGISSVITVYFFKPVWDKIILIWNNKNE